MMQMQMCMCMCKQMHMCMCKRRTVVGEAVEHGLEGVALVVVAVLARPQHVVHQVQPPWESYLVQVVVGRRPNAHLGTIGTGPKDQVVDRRVSRRSCASGAIGGLVVTDRALGATQWRAAVVVVLPAAAVSAEVARHLEPIDRAGLGLDDEHEDSTVTGVVLL